MLTDRSFSNNTAGERTTDDALMDKGWPGFNQPLAYHWAILADVPVPHGDLSMAFSP